jgi:hypothetical protein
MLPFSPNAAHAKKADTMERTISLRITHPFVKYKEQPVMASSMKIYAKIFQFEFQDSRSPERSHLEGIELFATRYFVPVSQQ